MLANRLHVKCLLLLTLSLPICLGFLNYCNPALCSHTKEKHIACRNDVNFEERCRNSGKIISINKGLRNFILNIHNNMRSKIAKGYRQFSPASKMATLRWSHELAFLAELNVRLCRMRHSECVATSNFPHVGQNLAYNKFSRSQNTTVVVKSQIYAWFNEFKHADMHTIHTGMPANSDNNNEVNQFLQLVRDRADRIGCAIAEFKDHGLIKQRLSCFYNVGLRHNCYPIYDSAQTAGDSCEEGLNSKYKYLCDPRETYDYKNCPNEPEPTPEEGIEELPEVVTNPAVPSYEEPDLSTDEPDDEDQQRNLRMKTSIRKLRRWVEKRAKEAHDYKYRH